MKQEIRDAVANLNFVIAFLLMLVCLLGMSIPEWLISVDWGMEYRQSALQQSISGIFFGGVMLLLPFCASLPVAVYQVDELRSSVFQWKLIRSSFLKYTGRKIIATMLSGGLAVALAFIVHSALWNLIALPCDPQNHPYHEIGFSPETLYAAWYSMMYGLPMYASMAVGIFICGASWALVSLTVSIWFPDKLMTISIPVCIYYLLSVGIFRHLFGWRLPHPATLYNDALTWYDVSTSLIAYSILIVLSSFMYLLGVKRRGQIA